MIIIIIVIIILKSICQEATRLTCQSSTRASNKRKHVTLTDKRLYVYTYKLAIEHISTCILLYRRNATNLRYTGIVSWLLRVLYNTCI